MSAPSLPDPLPKELRDFGQLVDLVYQGATDQSKWAQILPRMIEWVDAPRSFLFTPTLVPEGGGFVFTHNFPESFVELWRTRFQRDDPWANGALEQGKFIEGTVLLGSDMVPTAKLVASDYYKDFLQRGDIGQLLTGIVFGVSSPSGPPVVCSFFRSVNDEEFGAVERARLGLLLPHLSRSIGVMLRLKDAEFKVAASLAALDRLKPAVMLLSAGGRVVFANRAAQGILAEEDGLRMRSMVRTQSAAELIADASSEAQAAIARAIRGALNPDLLATTHFGKSVTIPRHSGRASYVLQFSSLAKLNEFGTGVDTPRAIVFVNDPADPLIVDKQILIEVYGLTPAETRVAELVAQGGTVQEAATALKVTENTVRTHLKQIYTKTGADSRARLVKLIYSLSSS